MTLPEQKATRSPSDLLNDSIGTTLASISNQEVKVNYAKAMIMATKLWVRNPELNGSVGSSLLRRPCSPEHIKSVARFNYQVQFDYKILLKKTDAPEFLRSMGKVINSESSFKKSYSNDKAGAKLVRKPASLSGEMLVCTYAEWLFMEDFAYEPELPQVLFEIIPIGWKCPEPETQDVNRPFTPRSN